MTYVQFAGIDVQYLSAQCDGAFNVSVVRLEYINEDNIAVVVRHSTYREYNVDTGTTNGSASGYTTYWLNPPTMQVSRSIFTTSVPTSNYAELCPSQQRTPRVGTFVAESGNALLFATRWAFNAFLYTPGMVPIWKAGGACPAPGASFGHTVLIGCGQSLYSLDDFFDSLDDASAMFWNALAVVAQLIDTASKAGPVGVILDGAGQYGEATEEVLGPGSAASAATDALAQGAASVNFVLGKGSEALSQAKSAAGGVAAAVGSIGSSIKGLFGSAPVDAGASLDASAVEGPEAAVDASAAEIPSEAESETETIGEPAAEAFQEVAGQASSFSSTLGESMQSMGGLAMNQISNAIGPVSGDPTSALGGAFQIQVAPLAWARFFYTAISQSALAIAKSALAKNVQTDDSIWRTVWGVLYDLETSYTADITQRMQMGCEGVQLILGYSNPWAQLAYSSCLMGAEYYASMFRIVVDLFVDIPLVKCVCVDAVGANVRAYVEGTCADALPLSARPTLFMIVNQIQGLSSKRFEAYACQNVINELKSTLNAELDPVFEAFEAGAEALAGVIDYTLIPFDGDAGNCLDFDNDPHIVVITPSPPDYFLQCANTSLCHSLCAAEWEAFQAADTTAVAMPTIEVETESVFFPGGYDSTMTLSNATAATQLNGTGVCTARLSGVPPDLALAVAQLTFPSLTVEVYCVPQAPGVGVYQVTSAGYGPYTLPGDLMVASFINPYSLALLLRIAGDDALYLASPYNFSAMPPLDASLVPSNLVLIRIVSMWPIEDGLVVDMVFRGFQGTTIVGSVLNFRYEPHGNASAWYPSTIDLSQYASQYWFNGLLRGTYYLLPMVAGLPVFELGFNIGGSYLQLEYITAATSLSSVPFQGGLGSSVLAAQRLQDAWAFAAQTSGWDWLLQVRFDGSGVFSSTSVTATMQQQVLFLFLFCKRAADHARQGHCDATSCEGCKDLATNRLCQAYNRCALVTCVGTPVNLRRPLCDLGGVLRGQATVGIQSFRAAWTILIELLATVLSLSVAPSSGANIAFPEDNFMGYVCASKDASANMMAVLTSALNDALYFGNANVGYMYDGASNVDTNADAMLTVTMTTVTAFLYQIWLSNLYWMLAAHQIYMCQTNGVLALMDETGFKLRIQSAASTTAGVAGQCLTIGDTVLANYPNENGPQLAYKVGSTLQNLFNILLLQRIDPELHLLDALLAYVSGILTSFSEILMSQFAAQCNPPEHYLKDVAGCACGDTPLAITPLAAEATEYAFWCTGTLSMVDGANDQIVVYNPYSYAQLQSKAGGMQAYLECASSSYKCDAPTDPVFTAQGVTLLNVLVKCRENFVEKNWDQAAYVLFDPTQRYRFNPNTVLPTSYADPYGVLACLVSQAGVGGTNGACLDQYLYFTNTLYDRYWAYAPAASAAPAPQYVDACLTFSGPASGPNSASAAVFENCVDAESDGLCTLSGHLWSPSSSNNVPVGQTHVVMYAGDEAGGIVANLYAQAQQIITAAVNEALAHWAASPVSAQFFSAEGDVIHQTLDCIFLGPYARVDYWPIPTCAAGEECLDGPFWSRDDVGATRSVDPYSCVTVNSLPYTCGSPGRQSLTRYFVNTFLSQTNSNSSVFQTAVRAQLNNIGRTFANLSKYSCAAGPCTDYFPDALNVPATYVSAQYVLSALDAHFDDVYTHALEKPFAWTQFFSQVAPGMDYDWTDSKRAEDEARFDPKNPIYEYAASEAMNALSTVDASLWDVCHAGLKQVFWTLPIFPDNNTIVFGADRNADGTYTPDPLSFDALPYDGDAATLESYVSALVYQASLVSPLFRHYQPRHAPSESLMCDTVEPPAYAPEGAASFADYVHHNSAGEPITVFAGGPLGTFPAYDYRMFAIGATPCPCGWPLTSAGCAAPAAACAAVNAAVGRTDCISWPANYSLVAAALGAEAASLADCPEFEVSPHFGYLDPAANEQWLRGGTTLNTSARDLLAYGRAGFRAGSLGTLRAQSKAWINPAARNYSVDRAKVTTCNYQEYLTAQQIVDGFVDELFPMAQGAEEAGAVAYCLRYVMELARLEAIYLVNYESYDASRQLQTVGDWRRRCGAQLQLLHVCRSLSVFRPPDLTVKKFKKTCGHFGPISTPTLYTTPECLVSYNGQFYDPCRCVFCNGSYTPASAVDPAFLTSTPACRIRFDPLTALSGAPIGYWPAADPDAAALNAFWSDPASLLAPEFEWLMLDDPDAAGNALYGSDPWYDAEGYMNTTAQVRCRRPRTTRPWSARSSWSRSARRARTGGRATCGSRCPRTPAASARRT